MKKVIILGGNNNHNIKWVDKMISLYQKDYDVSGIYYDSWYNDLEIDFDIELKKIQELMVDDYEHIIIAKSIGSILSLIGIVNGMFIPKKLIVMGLPLMFTEKHNIDLKYLLDEASKKTDIMVIQQKYDPLGKASDIENMLPTNVEFLIINGNNHRYARYEKIKDLVDKRIN